MKISSTTAKEIVKQISEVLEQKINIMDTNGIIIASSTAEREGSIHGGAKKIIRENLNQLIVENDSQYEGSQNGVNLPIVFQGEIVGIIGITGKVQEVLKFGQIIKRMTEILLLDERLKEKEIMEQKVRDRFFEEWIVGGYETKNTVEFYQMAEALAVKTDLPKRIVVFQMQFEGKAEDRVQTEVSRYIRRVVKEQFEGNAFRTATKIVCVLNQPVGENKLFKSLSDLQKQVKSLFGCRLFAGLDSKAQVLHLSESYRRAVKALEMSVRHNEDLTCYDELDIEFIFGNIPREVFEQYIHKLFGDQDIEKIQKHLDFARAYLDADGSLTVLSEKLFLHKNTVKYKIKRLEEVTGIDIRTTKGIYIFTLALKLWDNLPS